MIGRKTEFNFFHEICQCNKNMFRWAFYLSENTESFHKADQQIGFYVMTSIRFEAWKKNESKIFYFTGTGNRGFRQSFPKYVESYKKNFFN